MIQGSGDTETGIWTASLPRAREWLMGANGRERTFLAGLLLTPSCATKSGTKIGQEQLEDVARMVGRDPIARNVACLLRSLHRPCNVM